MFRFKYMIVSLLLLFSGGLLLGCTKKAEKKVLLFLAQSYVYTGDLKVQVCLDPESYKEITVSPNVTVSVTKTEDWGNLPLNSNPDRNHNWYLNDGFDGLIESWEWREAE